MRGRGRGVEKEGRAIGYRRCKNRTGVMGGRDGFSVGVRSEV